MMEKQGAVLICMQVQARSFPAVIKPLDDPYTLQGRGDRFVPSVDGTLAAIDGIVRWLPPELGEILRRLPPAIVRELEEIRLRAGRPLQLVAGRADWFVSERGAVMRESDGAMIVDPGLLSRAWQIVCEASVYSRDEEARHGYVTLPAGHRVGVAGRVLTENGNVLRFRDVAALNFRLARELPGCADPVIPHIWDRSARLPYNTLLLSPPGAGKTTLLRDLVRQVSTGVGKLGLPGLRVTVVDERGELAACHKGVPTRDIGPRTDVLDGCPKATGTLMALRSLSPQVVAFDELGGREDVRAVLEAAHAGVRIMTTAHARDPLELKGRPSLDGLPLEQIFQRVVVLGRHPRPGTLQYVGPFPVQPVAISPVGRERL